MRNALYSYNNRPLETKVSTIKTVVSLMHLNKNTVLLYSLYNRSISSHIWGGSKSRGGVSRLLIARIMV